MNTFRNFFLAVLSVSTLLLAPWALACNDASAAQRETKVSTPKKAAKTKTMAKPAAQVPAVGAAGRVVTRDPETGELRGATPEEINRLRASGRTTLAMPTVERILSDGTVELELGERVLAYSTLEKRPDGTLKAGCAVGREPSKPAPAPVTPVAEEK